MIEIVETTTFKRWIRTLHDRGAVARINTRLRSPSLVMPAMLGRWETA